MTETIDHQARQDINTQKALCAQNVLYINKSIEIVHTRISDLRKDLNSKLDKYHDEVKNGMAGSVLNQMKEIIKTEVEARINGNSKTRKSDFKNWSLTKKITVIGSCITVIAFAGPIVLRGAIQSFTWLLNFLERINP